MTARDGSQLTEAQTVVKPGSLEPLFEALPGCSRLLILCCGNPSRGDDAVGPLLYEYLVQQQAELQIAAGRMELIQDFQWQVEDAMEMEPSDLVLFIDAALDADPPFALRRVEPSLHQAHTSHALAPDDLLSVRQRLGLALPQQIWQLGVCGREFGLDAPISQPSLNALEATKPVLRLLLHMLHQSPD